MKAFVAVIALFCVNGVVCADVNLRLKIQPLANPTYLNISSITVGIDKDEINDARFNSSELNLKYTLVNGKEYSENINDFDLNKKVECKENENCEISDLVLLESFRKITCSIEFRL